MQILRDTQYCACFRFYRAVLLNNIRIQNNIRIINDIRKIRNQIFELHFCLSVDLNTTLNTKTKFTAV